MRVLAIISAIFFFQASFGQQNPDHYLKAMAFSTESNYDSALIHIDQYLTEKPGKQEAIYQRGLILFNAEKLQGAKEIFEKLDGKYKSTGNLMLAKIEARSGNTDKSIQHLRDYLRTSTKISESELLLDDDLLLIEKTEAWKSLWKEKEWYNPLDKQISEAHYLIENKNYLDAINLLNTLAKKGYKKSEVNQLLGYIYLKSENYKEARNCLDIAVKSDPRNLHALKLRIDLSYKTEEYESAEEDCQVLFRLSPAEFDYYLRYGEIKNKTGQYEEAREIINNYISLFPGDARAYYQMGKIHQENKKYLSALPAFNKALELESGEWSYFYSRGICYSSTRTYKYAIKDFSMALDLNPKNGTIWYEKGLAEYAYGDIENACHSFKKAYEYGIYDAAEYIERNCGK